MTILSSCEVIGAKVPQLGPDGMDSVRQTNRGGWALQSLAFAIIALMAGRTIVSPVQLPLYGDFGQYYMGGVIAAQRQWQALYPVPIPNSVFNPGFYFASTPRPAYARLADERGVGNVNRFFQPPPDALLFLPLGCLSFRAAYSFWTILQGLAGVGIAWLAGRYFRLCAPRHARHAPWVVLLVAASPLMERVIRTGQISGLVGFFIGLGMLGLAERQDFAGASGILVGGLLKYITPIFLPVVLVLRRWNLLIWLAVLGTATLLISLAVTGVGPFAEFVTVILPRLNRSYPWSGNQAICGLLLRATGRDVLSAGLERALSVARATVGLAILSLIFSRKRDLWVNPRNVFAACALLLTWSLAFSPLYWEHYAIYLCPLWGWLVAEALTTRVRTVLAILGIGLIFDPLTVYVPSLPQALQSHMLFGTGFIAIAAVAQLLKPFEAEPPAVTVNG